jgi:hypothetical protein
MSLIPDRLFFALPISFQFFYRFVANPSAVVEGIRRQTEKDINLKGVILNEQVIELISHGLERSSYTICFCFAISCLTSLGVVYLSKNRISMDKDTAEFHPKNVDHAISFFDKFRTRKEDKDWRDVS